jgi:hypothetical protein
MSDAVDEHLDKAFASLDDVPVRELMATSEALERRKDGLRGFASFFRNVAHARGGGRARTFPASTSGRPSPEPTRSSPIRSRGRGALLAPCARCASRAASVTSAALGAAAPY